MAKEKEEQHETEGKKEDGEVEETSFGEAVDKEEKPVQMVPYSSLFRYASTGDKIRLFVAVLAAIGTGASMPLMFIVFGGMTDDFVELGQYSNCFMVPNITTETPSDPPVPDDWNLNSVYFADPPNNPVGCESGQNPAVPYIAWNASFPELGRTEDFKDDFLCFNTTSCEILLGQNHSEILENMADASSTGFTDHMLKYTLFYIYFGIGTWACAWIQTTFLMAQCSNQINKIRRTFFESILRQDIGFFDTNSAGELNTRLADDVKKISDGMGDKIGITVQSVARFIAGLTIAFIYGWKLALVIMSIFPVLMISAGLMFSITTKFTKQELDAYATAGAIAEEVINSIKTVTAFAGQHEEIARYDKHLVSAKSVGIKKAVSTAFSIGTLFLVIYSAYGLGFWYGGKLVIEDGYSIGDVMLVFFGMLTGAFSLSAAANNIEFFAKARVAAHEIFAIIDRETPIDPMSEEGLKPRAAEVKAEVALKDVEFTYPARLDHKVLHGVSFEALEGQTVALCGQSGCGKSTCIQLIQRFYDPQAGSVTIGGIDIKSLNVKYLRDMIGVVSQEPILFETTIKENIRYGRLDVSDKEIFEAAKQANAFDFIERLPNKWDTQVGEGGATLSGGQKQRVAIARALVRNPKILLLDEATSALDTESEAIVQTALERASKGRTTIVIAHRLSTIRNADKIIGFVNGRIVEQGTHESLLKIDNGVYANLCNMQTFDKAEEKEKSAKTQDKKAAFQRQKSEKVASSGETEVKEDIPLSPWTKILAMNKPEAPFLVVGTIFSAFTGCLQPLFAVIFAEILAIFSENLTDEELSAKINRQAVLFVLLGVSNFVGNVGAISCFGKAGEELTRRIRSQAFRKYMSLEMAYFDHPLNSTGALTTRLATDASRVQGATGSRMALIAQNLCSLVFAFAIAFYFQWQLTLVCTAFVPIMAASGFFMMQLFSGKMAQKEQLAFEKAGKIATEATLNIRTVASLAREETFYSQYNDSLKVPIQAAKNKEVLYGFAYGSSQAIVFFAYAGCFHFGAFLIEKEIIPPDEFNNIYKVLMAIVFGAMAVGQSSAFAPDYGEAQLSAARMIKLFETESKIDPNDPKGKRPAKCSGTVTFESVHFTYPTRPDVTVLRGLSIDVSPGQTLALVGQSGCGKSTCIQLIQRFYDGTAGNVKVDGVKVNDLNLKWLRAQIGFVQQEPILFEKTIEENILYGLDDDIGHSNQAYVPPEKVAPETTGNNESKIEQAAKEANAFNFITGLPSGFKTNCGKKGSQLSGGQKQRVAIARALIRQPKILLLDEATSALDAESEKIVQEALDKAREGRTCILIAHRLSTVISADKIAVVDNGKIIEVGTHDELIKNQGAYFSLVNSQL